MRTLLVAAFLLFPLSTIAGDYFREQIIACSHPPADVARAAALILARHHYRLTVAAPELGSVTGVREFGDQKLRSATTVTISTDGDSLHVFATSVITFETGPRLTVSSIEDIVADLSEWCATTTPSANKP